MTSRNSLRKLLDEFSEIIAEVEEHQERRRRNFLILRVKLLLIDSSEVFIREIWRGDDLIAYSYYWLAPDGELLEGWDNTSHQRHVEGEVLDLPHHDFHDFLKMIMKRIIGDASQPFLDDSEIPFPQYRVVTALPTVLWCV